MTKRLICVFFTVVFVAFLTTPTIITFIDNDIDVSVFYASPEEEEKGNEKNKDYEKLFFETPLIESTFAQTETLDDLEYIYKNYPKPQLSFIAPPPDFNII